MSTEEKRIKLLRAGYDIEGILKITENKEAMEKYYKEWPKDKDRIFHKATKEDVDNLTETVYRLLYERNK